MESERQRDSAVTSQKLADAAAVRAEASRLEAVSERTAAVSAQTATKKINDFLVSIFQGVNPARGGKRDASALELIAEAEKRLGDLKGVDADQQARLFHALGSLHGVIGQTEKSVAYYERELTALEGYCDKTLAQRVELLASISVRRRNASMPGAMAAARESVRLATVIQRTDPRSFVLANNGLMVSLNAEGRYAEAHRIGRLTDDSWHANFPDPWADAGYLTFRSNWAFGHYRMGDYVEAEREFKRVLELRLARPTSIEREIAQTMAPLALTVYELGRASEAIAMLRQSLARTQSALGEASATHRMALGHLAALLRKTERFAECEAVLKTIDDLNQKYGEDGDERVGQLIARGNLAAAQGKVAEAIDLQGRAFAVYSKSLGETSYAAVSQLGTLVELHLRMHDVAKARETAEKNIALRKRTYTKFDEPLLNAQRTLATVETAAGEHQKAAQILQEVIDNYAATSLGFQRRVPLAAARAWQQLAALPHCRRARHHRTPQRPPRNAPSPTRSWRSIWRKKTTGENSSTYRTSKALLAKLETTARGRGGKLIAVLGEPEE